MPCLETVKSKQTEFDFYQQLMRSPKPETCCGSRINLSLTSGHMQIIKDILRMVSIGLTYLDTFEPQVLDSNHIQLTMCSRHWLQLQDLLHQGSHRFEREDWNDLSFYIFKSICLYNSWDSKELSNYLS